MAALPHVHRFVKLNDRFDTQIFTFLLPSTLVRDYSKDVFSRDFNFGHQRWSAMFIRSDRHIGAFLKLKNIYAGMKVIVDYGFTMINREHFTKNESFVDKASEFSFENKTHGRRSFISIGDLAERNFKQENGEFLVELELRGIRTFFEEVLQLPKEGKDASYGFRKLETSYFTFGYFDWSVAVYPYGDRQENENSPIVYLIRQTSFDHLCRVCYKVTFGQADKIVDTDIIEQTLDASGFGEGYDIGVNLHKLALSKSRLRIRVELIWVSAVSEVKMHVFDRARNVAHLYDRDKQAWLIQSDTSKEHLSFKLFYSDVNNVPRNYMRYVYWDTVVVPLSGRVRPVRTLDGPHSNYYTQGAGEQGYEMVTGIPVAELQEPENIFLEDGDDTLTVQIEWLDSHLLYHGGYHPLDDIGTQQRHQMRREILALQAENFALEKQLHSYQQSIARTHARNRNPEEDWLGDEPSTSGNSF